MILEELKTILEETGLPVAYLEFNRPIEFPVICYYEQPSNNLFADGITYFAQCPKIVELYTDYKSPEVERLVESVLTNHEIAWEKTDEQNLEDEKCYLIMYRIEV